MPPTTSDTRATNDADRKPARAPSKGTSRAGRGTRPSKRAMKLPCDEGIRWDRVARARAEIAAGTLETPERVAATVEQLMDVLFPQNC